MRSNIPEKLLSIVEEIDARGCANLTRLTMLKKWFERPGRLPAFGLWVAQRSAGRKGRTGGTAGALLDEAHALLGSTATRGQPAVDRRAALSLHDRARDFQNEHEPHRWASVRIIHCWPLLLVEKGLALHLRLDDSPTAGYKLAADFCQHYDPKHGNSLCGPGRTKVMEIVRFMFTVEATEDDPGRPPLRATVRAH